MKLNGKCESFEQVCEEMARVMDGDGVPSRNVRRAVPLGFGRWSGWLYGESLRFMVAMGTEECGPLMLDPDVGLSRLAHEPFAVMMDDGLFTFSVRDPKTVAGRVFPTMGSHVLFELALTDYRGHGKPAVSFVSMGERGFRRVDRNAASSSRGPDQPACRMLSAAMGYRLTMRYEWQAAIGRSDGISVMFPVERAGCSEVFRLRDIPPGKARRSALRNFVEKYARRRPGAKDQEADTAVRRHLRGEAKFEWNGLRVELVPPAYDVALLGGAS
jgi:hypothetical protein